MSLPGGHKRCTLWALWIDQNSRAVGTNIVVMRTHSRACKVHHAHGPGHQASLKVRGKVTVLCCTCFESPVVSMFEQSEEVTISLRLLVQACSCVRVAYNTDTGSKFTPFVSAHVHASYSDNRAKNKPRTSRSKLVTKTFSWLTLRLLLYSLAARA